MNKLTDIFQCSPTSRWKEALCLMLLAVLAWFFCLHNLGAASIDGKSDEVIHVRVVQEMRQSGDLLHPTYGGIPYFNKPPLKMWLSLAPLAIFGESNYSYRLIDGLSGVGILYLVFGFARRYFDARLAGLLAALTLCGARAFVLGAHGIRHATQDAFMLLLTTAAMFAGFEIVRGYRGERPTSKRAHASFCFATGLAVFTKSVGGSLPLIVLGAYLLTDRQSLRGALTHWRWWLIYGALGFAPVAAFYAYHLSSDFQSVISSFTSEIIDRALIGYHNRSRGYYYWRGLFLRDAVGTPLILGLALVVAAWSAWRDYRYRFILLWALLPICLYSLSRSKLPWYILVSYPALALVIGLLAQLLLEQRRYFRLPAVLAVFVIGSLSYRAYRIGTHVVREKRLPIDMAVEQVQRHTDSSTAVVENPLRLKPDPRKYRRRIEFIYLSMLAAKSISKDQVASETAKNFFCLAEACAAIEAEKGAPLVKQPIAPLRPRREVMFLLQY